MYQEPKEPNYFDEIKGDFILRDFFLFKKLKKNNGHKLWKNNTFYWFFGNFKLMKIDEIMDC